MKKIIVLLLCSIYTATLFAQTTGFTVRADGSFVSVSDGKPYITLPVPGKSAEELYYAFLISLRHKCVNHSAQMDVVENKAINVYDYESNLKVGSIWTAQFDGYLYYKFLFQFKDGMIRIEAPIVSRFGKNGTTFHYTFEYMLNALQLFNADGSPKKEKHIATINSNTNLELSSFIEAALQVTEW